MELRIGLATPIDVPPNLSFIDKILYLKSLGHVFEYVNEENEDAYSETIEYINDTFYRIQDSGIGSYDEYVDGSLNSDGSISYACHWHNSGAQFTEVLAEAIKNAHDKLRL